MSRVPHNFQDLTNFQFGRLTVVRQIQSTGSYARWLCRCECGNETSATSGNLKKGNVQSCGCLGRVFHRKKSGEAAFNLVLRKYKGRNREFALTAEEFRKLTKGNCFYCNRCPSAVQRTAAGEYVYNGIDRVDSSLGYTTENCVPCCTRCNVMKMDAPKTDFIQHCKRIAEAHA